MSFLNYSHQIPAQEAQRYARAQRYDIDASYKDLAMVCLNIRGKKTEAAQALLEKAAKGEWPIWFRTYNTRLGHRGELGGKKGRYPVKSVKFVLNVLKNAVANANGKGLLGTLVVEAASANKHGIIPRIAPRGRWRRHNIETALVQIVLREVEEAKAEVKTEKKKVLEAKAKVKREKREEEQKKVEEMIAAAGGETGTKTEQPKSEEEKKAEKAVEKAAKEVGQ